uniref:Uncharacterized protein n=1 Tax=Anguilla anguilla TaxID=7936 RepID=A0A0E9QZS5_ANGAN
MRLEVPCCILCDSNPVSIGTVGEINLFTCDSLRVDCNVGKGDFVILTHNSNYHLQHAKPFISLLDAV